MNKVVVFIYFLSGFLQAKSETADFTYTTSSGLFCNPATVQFTSSYTGNPKGFVWTFGNGMGSNNRNPLIIYDNAGSYTVKLIVIYQGSTVVITKTILINSSITATIGYDRNYICKPGDINFSTANNGNVSQYNWNFGDGSNAAVSNKIISHNFVSPGIYHVTLLATDASGCFDTTSTSITVQPTPITGNVSPSSGCIPASVNFKASASIPVSSSVSNYLWNFGDGSAPVSTAANSVNHVYSATGNFLPSVTVNTSEGCTNTYTFQGVAYGTPPFNLVTYPIQSVLCGSDTARFISKATNANSYTWDFGDGLNAHVSDTVVQHKFDTLGNMNIRVTPEFGGCPGNSGSFQIRIIGVVARFDYSNTCADRKTFSFNNTSQGNLSTISWDFGDGSPVVNTINATHTFPPIGTFITKLTVTDNVTGCSDTYLKKIYTANPVLVNPDSAICKNSNTTFSVIDGFNNPSTTYSWNVVGNLTGDLTDSSHTAKASLFGNFSNYVIILNGKQYCYDTVRLNHLISVRGPDLSFTAPPSICINDLYSVINTSKPYLTADSVKIWYWNFGGISSNDTIYQPQPHLYTNPGNYSVKLAGIDINGCTDSISKTLAIHQLPFLYVISGQDTLCSGSADTLIAFHSDSIRWSPAMSLSCSDCDTALAYPTVTTKYYATATSKFGCISSDSTIITVYAPFTATTDSPGKFICVHDTVHLQVEPAGKRVVWSPTVGLSNPNIYNPVASPVQSTTYQATLTDSVGCFTSTTNINVTVKTLPTVDAGPDQSLPFNSPFTIQPIYSNNAASYLWVPGNLLNCGSCPDPTGIANSSNTFVVQVTSDSGCIAKDSINIFIECKDVYLFMPNGFTPNGDNINDMFYPMTRGVKSVIRFAIYDRMGNLVFEAKNFRPNDKRYGWDGRINGAEQSTGVYVYYMEALCDLGQKLYKKGSVTLIR